jgi:oligopeptide/dipeptide ABC transporter ATP-binding protein
VRFEGQELLGAGDPAARVRGRGIGFVFQDASGSLTPHRRIGDQLAELGTLAEAERMLERVRLPEARRHLAVYPHELSGGMRQRVAIAAALMQRPQLLFADEPTTALDVTVQAEIIVLLADLCTELGMAMLLVTHDLGVVSGLADRIAVMYAGRIVESAPSADFLAGPRHPYSAGLLAAVPSIDDPPGSELRTIAGTPPPPGTVLPGCRFEPRCAQAQARCRGEDPPWVEREGAGIACHFPLKQGR